MNREEMFEQAKLFNEAMEVKNKKPILLQEMKGEIKQLEQEIKELETKGEQQVLANSFGKLNPKRFFNKEEAEVNVDELTSKKENEIKAITRKHDVLADYKLKDVVDLNAVVDEVLSILELKNKEIEKLKPSIIKSRNEYHELLDYYNLQLGEYNAFASSTNNDIIEISKEGFIPMYSGELPPGIAYGVGRKSFDAELLSGHRGKTQQSIKPE